MISKSITSKNGTVSVRSFGGLSREPKNAVGEFSDMENMTHKYYPSISSVKGSSICASAPDGAQIVKYIIPKYIESDKTKFSGVAKEADGEYSIYINGVKKCGGISEFSDAVDFGGSIITIPEFKGFNYVVKNDYDSANIKPYKATTKNRTAFSSSSDGSNHEVICVSNDVNFFNKFDAGKCIAISGCTGYAAENNTWYPENSLDYSKESPVMIKVISLTKTNGNLYVAVYDAKGKMTSFPRHEPSPDGITVEELMPRVEHICMHKNRLWATSKSGEFIYASAPGKPLEFYKFDNLSTSSWYGSVGTPGKFMGIVSWNSRVIAFKKNSMNIVYGDNAKNFSIEKKYTVGCIDKNSIACISDSVIWLGGDGFYLYSGSAPKRISDKLCGDFSSCRAFACEGKYYAECVNGDKEEFLVYDLEKNLWSKLKCENLLGGECDGRDIYIWDESNVKKMFSGSFGDFYFETVPMYFDSFDNQSVIKLYIRCQMKDGAFLNIYTKTEKSDFSAHRGISKSGKSKIPIRYKSGDCLILRFEGNGDVCITDVEMMFTTEVT